MKIVKIEIVTDDPQLPQEIQRMIRGRYFGRALAAKHCIQDALSSNKWGAKLVVGRAKDGTILGVAAISPRGAELYHLGINPRILTGKIKARRIGTRMMVEIAKIAVRYGCDIKLLSLNENSDIFYRRLGMREKKHLLKEGEWNQQFEWTVFEALKFLATS